MLGKGEIVGIVGESGSGKSVFTKLFVGMLDKNGKITNGKIMYDGMDLTTLTGQLLTVINAVFAFLVILGVIVDPTTEGVSDSNRAMGYQRPATSKVE